MSGALEATGGWASFEPPLPFGFEWKTLRRALLGWRHGQGEEEEGGGRDARSRRRTRPPAGEVRDGGRGEGGERRQDSRPPAGEARDEGGGEEEEEVVHAGARQDSRSPAGEARDEGGGGSHSRSRTRRKRPSGSKRKGLRLPGKRRRIPPDLGLDGGVGQHAQGFALAREEEEKMAPGEGEKSRACRRTTKTHAHRRAGITGRGRR